MSKRDRKKGRSKGKGGASGGAGAREEPGGGGGGLMMRMRSGFQNATGSGAPASKPSRTGDIVMWIITGVLALLLLFVLARRWGWIK